MSPKGNTRVAVSVGHALSLCERGWWSEAADLVSAIKDPAEALLIRGCSLVLTRPEESKDLLSRAVRLLPVGDLQERGKLWLATAYWATGEEKEAHALLGGVGPTSNDVRFLVGLNSSIFGSSKVRDALASLKNVETLIDSVSDLYRAKFFLQRGWLRRRLNQIDSAIIDYEAARILFESSDAPRYFAVATNNVAGLLIDADRFDDAHDAVDSAIKILSNDPLYFGQFHDQKAQVFIAQGKNTEAERYAARAVALLITTDHKSVLAECLITHAKALRGLGRYVHALGHLEQARAIAEYLNSKTILFDVCKEEKQTAQDLLHDTHVEMVETALHLSGDSLRGAARMVGIKPQPLQRFIRLHKIECHPKVKKSIISKPVKHLIPRTKKPLKKA